MNLAKKKEKMDKALGKRLLEAVGLELTPDYNVTGLGSFASITISQASRIVGFGRRPTHKARLKAAKKIDAKARDLVEAIERYNAEWPPALSYPLHDFMQNLVGEDPQTKKHDSFTAERLKWLRGISYDFDKEADLAERDAISANGLSEFIREWLTWEFEKYFGQVAAVKFDPAGSPEHSGPFLSYARFILDEAGAGISDAAIRRAIQRKNT